MKSSGMKMYMSKTWVVFVCALVCCFLWGSAFPCNEAHRQINPVFMRVCGISNPS